jgi:hypothetical protein
VLRNIGTMGQLPLGWGESDDWRDLLVDLLHLPLLFPESGNKVVFGAASGQDLDQWHIEDSADDDRRQGRRAETRTGVRFVRGLMDEQGVDRVDDLRPPDDESDVDQSDLDDDIDNA